MEKVKLSKSEKQIVARRIGGLSFNQMDDKKLIFSAKEIMLAVGAVTGCSLPNTKAYSDIVETLLVEFILEQGYGDLNFDEIILALQLNMTGILSVDGYPIALIGNFSIDFIANVLRRYMTARNVVDGKIRNKIDEKEN